MPIPQEQRRIAMEEYANTDHHKSRAENVPAGNTVNRLPTLRSLYKLRWLLLASMSATMYAVVALLSSTLAEEIDPFLVTFTRTFLSTMLAAIVACYNGSSLRISSRTELRLHLVQSILTTICFFCQFYAYLNMPASDANAIIYSQVVLVGVVGRCIYKEPFGIVEFITVCTAAVGVVLISRPSFLFGSLESDVPAETLSFVPTMVAVIASVIGAIQAVHSRAMVMRNITGMSLMFYSMLLSSVILAVPVTIFNQWKSFLTVCVGSRFRLVIVSISAFMAYSFYNFALFFENTVYVSLVVLNNILIVFVCSIIFLGFTPTWPSVVGMVIILGSCAFLSLKRIKDYREQRLDSTRNGNSQDEALNPEYNMFSVHH